MRVSCTICSDLFEDSSVIVSTPCGHIYHETCIQQWLMCSKTCPECRKAVTSQRLLKLYFNVTSSDEKCVEILENELYDLRTKIRIRDIDVEKYKSERQMYKEYIKAAEDKADKLQQTTYELKSQIVNLGLTIKSLSKFHNKVKDLEETNRLLTKKLENLQNVDAIVTGSQKDADDVLREIGENSSATRQLATCCTLLKREVQKTSNEKQELRDEIIWIKKENAIQSANMKRLLQTSNKYKAQINELEEEVRHMSNRKPVQIVTENKIESVLGNMTKSVNSQMAINKDNSGTPKCVENMKIVIEQSESSVMSKTPFQPKLLGTKLTFKRFAENKNSVIRNGYNGLGGHSKFITPGINRQPKVALKRMKLS